MWKRDKGRGSERLRAHATVKHHPHSQLIAKFITYTQGNNIPTTQSPLPNQSSTNTIHNIKYNCRTQFGPTLLSLPPPLNYPSPFTQALSLSAKSIHTEHPNTKLPKPHTAAFLLNNFIHRSVAATKSYPQQWHWHHMATLKPTLPNRFMPKHYQQSPICHMSPLYYAKPPKPTHWTDPRHTRTTCLNPQISVVYYKNPLIPLLASANKPSRPIHCQPITPQPIKAYQINSKATE